MNTNVLRKVLNEVRQWQSNGLETEACCVGNKGLGFMSRLGVNVVSQITGLGDAPSMEKLIGAIKVVLDAYTEENLIRYLYSIIVSLIL